MNKTLNAALISLGSVSSRWTYDAMKRYFKEVDHINIKELQINLGSKEAEILHQGKPLKEYDCIFAKGSFRYADVLQAIRTKLEETCYMPISAKAFATGHDKVLSHIQMQKAKVPQPLTYLSSSVKAAKELLKKINYPIIMKLPKGTQGKGVMVADSYASASSMLDTLEALRQPVLIQEFIDTGGEDIRTIVVGDKVVAAMKRIAQGGDARANIHAGGASIPFTPDSQITKISLNAAKAIGANICAVDILESAKGPVVLEINLSPGLQGITKTTKIDVADKMAKYLHEKAIEKVSEQTQHNASKILEDVGIDNCSIEEEDKEIITNLDLRNNKILLPELFTKITNFDEDKEVVIKVKKGSLSISSF